MIIVNLLPLHLRPVKHSPLPYYAAVAVLLIAILGMCVTFFAKKAEIGKAGQELDAVKTELAALADTVDRWNALMDKKDSLREKVDTIKEILSDRIIWSEKLHRLAALTPKNIWYSDIKVVMVDFQENVVKVDPKGRAIINEKTGLPDLEKKRVKRRVLQVSGYVIRDESGRAQISPLLAATTEDEEFSRDFSLEPPEYEDTEFNGTSVRGFTLKYVIRPRGED